MQNMQTPLPVKNIEDPTLPLLKAHHLPVTMLRLKKNKAHVQESHIITLLSAIIV